MKLIVALFLVALNCSSKAQNNIVFEENFEGKFLNTNNWNYEIGDGCPNNCGFGNNERQQYTRENLELKDGLLVITAIKNNSDYKSARINTKGKVEMLYGTVEVRAKLPTGKGIWPAIWMLGSSIETVGWPACGEIDIMEYVGKEPNILYTSMHTSESSGNTINSKKTSLPNIEEGFHNYKMNWTKESIQFYFDDQLVYTYAPQIKNEKNWPFDKPCFIILNMAVGGNFGGPEVDDSIFPQQFSIDYVKIYKP